MNLRRAVIAAFAAVLFSVSAFAASTTIVISEFRTRGPAGGNDEFIELLNVSPSPVDISGWKINGSNSAGTASTRLTVAGGTILQPGCRFLATNSSTGGYSGSVPGNQTYTTGITDDGGIALLNASATIVDQVGMSAGSAYKEGTTLAALTTNVDRSYARNSAGADTDNNAADFSVLSPSTPEKGCSGPVSTPPTGTAAATPSSANIGDAVLLVVTVTPGANPASSGIGVTANLSPIGGAISQPLYDDGTHGDVTAGDSKFSLSTSVAAGTTGGTKTLTFTIADAQSRSTSASATVTVVAPTNLAITGAANPSSLATGASTLLTATVTPATGPASTGIVVTGDVSSIGGSSSQPFFDDGTHGDVTAGDKIYSYSATVPSLTPLGPKTISLSVQDNESRSATASIALTITAPTIAPGTIVISQVYGGGGNSGSTLKNDFIELFNRSNSAVVLDGWSVQYFSSTTSTWSATPLSGVIQPYHYYLVQEAAGAGGTVDLPAADATGTLALSSSAGRVALVAAAAPLTLACPTGAQIIDFVGYGGSSTSCAETKAIGLLTNTTAAFRVNGGCKDTNNNSVDFSIGAPGPRNSSSAANDCTIPVPAVAPHVVISQVYAGGGNSGAVYGNDFVELYNPTASPVNLNNWSIQYAAATGAGWGTSSQPLGGTIAPGDYFLIQLAGGTSGGPPLPPARIINNDLGLGASAGKIALVKRVEGLSGNCPIGDPDLVDFVGYGAADCYEGGLTAPAPSNDKSLWRADNGNTDTDQNSVDFALFAPNPRGSGALVDLLPRIISTDPVGPDAPFDASMTINFSESVTVSGSWFSISCDHTGPHGDVEVAAAFTRKTYILTPNITFQPGETCTVHVLGSLVVDEDGNPDTLPSDYSWTFTVATGAPVETADVHLTMGNPSGATINDPNNFLMQKPEYALSYNNARGTANWVSWHLTDDWTVSGSGGRTNDFRPDPALPRTWYRVLQTDYSGSGFDRGHMSPSADRTATIPVNQATFLMSNMVPQSPDNNQGPWEKFEAYLRSLLPSNEIYVVSGPAGTGGTGSNGAFTAIANGHVIVPAETWKVVLVLPKLDGNDISRVTAATKTIAIRIPNAMGIKNDDWAKYLTTVRTVEDLTGFNFFSAVPPIVQNSIERGTNGVNPPGVADESATALEDTPASITLAAVSPNPQAAFTWTIDVPPVHGALSGTAPNVTYTPAPEYSGSDSFKFHVSDGTADSNTSTVSIRIDEVNDPPVAGADSAPQVEAGSSLTIAAATLLGNDSAGPANESNQTLAVTAVASTADTHGVVSLAGGQITYTPTSTYTGAASFTYTVCDNGTTAGAADPKCASATVSTSVVDTTAPAISALSVSTNQLWPANHQMVAVTVSYTATDITDPSPACTMNVLSNEPVNGLGDGDQAPDWEIIDAHHLRLRAERSGTGDGRIYTISADCADHFGNRSHSGNATVTVPKSQK